MSKYAGWSRAMITRILPMLEEIEWKYEKEITAAQDRIGQLEAELAAAQAQIQQKGGMELSPEKIEELKQILSTR